MFSLKRGSAGPPLYWPPLKKKITTARARNAAAKSGCLLRSGFCRQVLVKPSLRWTVFSASFLVMAGSRQSHHRVGYDSSWEREFPWHQPVFDTSNTTVEGLLCNICKQHRTGQRNKAGTWSTKPCTLLRRDILQRHKRSLMHKEAEEMEATRLASKKDGGIRQVMSARVLAQRKAIIGALQMMYWLAKEEIPHTTNFSSLKAGL